MTTSPRTAFVHIGAPKTGTTSIQAAFSQSRDALHASGFHYLEGERKHSERLALAFWDPEDARRLAGLHSFEDRPFDQTVHRDAICEELDAAAPRHVIISADELTEFRDAERAALMGLLRKEFDAVKVVAYAREPQSWMHSAGQQAIKWSGATLPDLFDRPRLPRYRERFAGFQADAGPDGFELRLFGGVDVVSDFAAAIGVPPGIVRAAERQNEALTKDAAIVLAAINASHPPFVDCRHNPFRAFGLIRTCDLPGQDFLLPRDTIDWAAPALADDRDYLAELLGRPAFPATALPVVTREAWMDGRFQPLQSFAEPFGEACRAQQNELAMRLYLTACQSEDKRAEDLLSRAALLATDRWTLGQIAEASVSRMHPDRAAIFAKQRLMRRIEAPEPGDPPLGIGNPFDRYWRADTAERLGWRDVDALQTSPLGDCARA